MIASGRYGAVNSISQLQNWNLEWTMTDDAQANSYTRAGKMRDEGIQDWTGGGTWLGSSLPSMDGFNFTGYTAPANGTYGTAGTTYSGRAIWNSISINADVSSGGRVNVQMQFGGDGALTVGNSAVTDVANPAILLAKDCVVKFGDDTLRWKSFSLNITNDVQTLVDSGTNGWTARYSGILDFTGSVTQATDVKLADNGTLGTLLIKCGDLKIFELNYARVMSFGGLTVDPSSGAIIEATTNFGMAVHNDEGTLGSMTVLGTQIWPPSVPQSSSSSGES